MSDENERNEATPYYRVRQVVEVKVRALTADEAKLQAERSTYNWLDWKPDPSTQVVQAMAKGEVL